MNTPIISISEDQNVICNKSGFIGIATRAGTCSQCCYQNTKSCNNDAIPCYVEDREDGKSVIFEQLKKKTSI